MKPGGELGHALGDPDEHSERMLGFLHRLQTQADPNATGDVRTAAYAQAAHRAVILQPPFRTMMERLITVDRPNIDPAYAVNLTLRALQKQLLRRYGFFNEYPLDYTEPPLWENAISWVSDPSNTDVHTDFKRDLEREVASNIADRYKAVGLILNFLGHDRDNPASIVDKGCSQNLGLKKLQLGQKMPGIKFRQGDWMKFNPLASAMTDDGRLLSRRFRNHLNRNLQIGFKLEPSLGIDLGDIDDPAVAEWAKSCSFYPSMLLVPEKVEEYDWTVMAILDNIASYVADITKMDEAEFNSFKESMGIELFDYVTFITMLHQLSPEERPVAIEAAKKQLKPGGLIIIQDFAEVDPEDPSQLIFDYNWHGGTYNYCTFILDPEDPSGRLYEIFRWENGRCRNLMLGRDFEHLFKLADKRKKRA